ncbi:transglycosylase domain-containing protein [Cellulomonas sp. PhB143]|uniref:transglycosylase domain-containing protein n=1 Tax=Cellulomonas sp. PhB143 TaxID=2485186 RepID=UPI000F4A169A|nr:transglycosylase domain-containing protein [Cellulomonas sp. PhB143]ROS78871.1 membrane peptidoglycan carboxypeptidase [Cellulomonas sp. PhB143]
MSSPARADGRHVNVFQLVALLLALVLVAGVGGLLVGGMFLPFAAATKTATDSAVQIFDDLPDDLEPGPLSEQSRIYANDGKTVIARYWTENRIVVPGDQVSQYMKDAVVATEDKRFWEHGGVDIEGTARAAVNNAFHTDTQGASTLTQQYVKNVLIEKATRDGDELAALNAREDTIERKMREAKLAIALEKKMSKTQILESYLNISQFGVGVYGVETAARYYFGKNAEDLSPVEAATIAGVTKAPSAYDPTKNPDEAKSRRDTVLNLMYQQNYITKDQYDDARSKTIKETLDVHPVGAGCSASQQYAFFCQYVTDEITNDPAFGKTAEERKDLLYRGGLDIVTTVDPKMQKSAFEQVTKAVPADDSSGLEDALVSIEPGSGKILAMTQNREYDPSDDPAKGTTSLNYSAGYGQGGSRGFQVGSAFKPFVLAEWLRSGRTLNDVVNANHASYPMSSFTTSCKRLTGSPWAPRNSESTETGNMSVLRATYDSVNTAYARMGNQLDLCGIRDTAWDMGYRPSNVADPTEDDIEVFAPMIIGTGLSSPLSMASAYATIADEGTYCEPMAITKITGSDGKALEVPKKSCKDNALDPRIANTMIYAMKDVLTQGTGAGLELADGRPAAGKTGTAQLGSQTWFAGFTPYVSTAVWVGNAESNDDHSDLTVNGTKYEPFLYGNSVAGPIWQSYMNTATSGMPKTDFPGPDASMVGRAPAPPAPKTEAKSDDSKADDSKADDAKADDKKADSKADDKKAAEKKADDAKKDDKKSDKK